MPNGWIGVDLDGTLAMHESGSGIEIIGGPIGPMVARVKAWLAEGQEVRIVTARVGNVPSMEPQDLAELITTQRVLIGAWCEEHLGKVLDITASKDFMMTALWDDRAVQVLSNQGIALQDIGNYGKPVS